MQNRIINKMTLVMVFTLSVLCARAISQEAAATAGDDGKSSAKASKATPRRSDGHPDLSGIWGGGGGGGGHTVKHGDTVEVRFGDGGGGGDKANIARRAAAPNQPPYKPELTDKVKDLAVHESQMDPAFFCKPSGVPRMGPPKAILQTPGLPMVAFLYEEISGNTYRLIPTDGRSHDPDADPSYMGDSVGHWEGDTLVVDTVNFNDDTWLGIDGWFHSAAMHVTERINREGDTLHYQATVEDPNVFTRPWIMNPRTLKASTDMPLESGPCMDRDESHLVNHDHH